MAATTGLPISARQGSLETTPQTGAMNGGNNWLADIRKPVDQFLPGLDET
jgi:hypothetical protein